MKAILHHAYGGPDVLRCEDIAVPSPDDDQVLIKVHAASVNPLDWHFMRGTPYVMRLQSGLLAPKMTSVGVDVAGRVESVGRNVTEFAPGDEVFGAARGSFAEFACAAPRALARKPASVSFEQAAATPIAALTALGALRDVGRVQAGQKVLVNGASGGVGTFAVQIAKSFGADVTAVCSTKNLDLVRSIGADHVIDYTEEDFTSCRGTFDVIVDNAGRQTLFACRRSLTASGRYVIVGAPSGRWISPFDRVVGAMVLSRVGSQQMRMVLMRGNREDFEIIGGLLAAGTIRSVVDRRYPLSKVPEAVRYVEDGHTRGKVIIEVI